jgi:hypothetical protein
MLNFGLAELVVLAGLCLVVLIMTAIVFMAIMRRRL